MDETQLKFMNGPVFRGLWVSNVVGRGRLWTVTWLHEGEFMETDYHASAQLAVDAAIRHEAGEWLGTTPTAEEK